MFIPQGGGWKNVVVSCFGPRFIAHNGSAVFEPSTRLPSFIDSPYQQFSATKQTIGFCSVEGENIADSDISQLILPNHGPAYFLLLLDCILSLSYLNSQFNFELLKGIQEQSAHQPWSAPLKFYHSAILKLEYPDLVACVQAEDCSVCFSLLAQSSNCTTVKHGESPK